MLLCRDTKCSIHNQGIDSFYNSIMSVFKQATIECIPSSSNCNKIFVPIPGWNEYFREHHKFARDAFKWWTLNKRPRDGYIYHEMKTSRARFKYAVRFTRSIKDTTRADSLAKDLSGGTIDDFWANVRKIDFGNGIQDNTIDCYSGEADIAGFGRIISKSY